MKQPLLITGANGFIGQNLLKKIDPEKFDIISVSRSTQIKGIKNIQADLTQTNFDFLDEVKPDYVIYLGTIASPKMANDNPTACFETNVTAIWKFLEKARTLNIKKIILFSSAVLYKDQEKEKYQEEDTLNPNQDIYNFSKFTLENTAQYFREKYNLAVTVFRLSNSYGPFQDLENSPLLIPQLFKQALRDKKIEVWNTQPIRDWVFVEDVVKVLLKELDTKDSGLFNLGTGVGTNVGKIVEIISQLTNSQVINLQKSVNPPFKVVLDVTSLQQHLNYVPSTSIEEALKQTYNFYTNSI